METSTQTRRLLKNIYSRASGRRPTVEGDRHTDVLTACGDEWQGVHESGVGHGSLTDGRRPRQTDYGVGDGKDTSTARVPVDGIPDRRSSKETLSTLDLQVGVPLPPSSTSEIRH